VGGILARKTVGVKKNLHPRQKKWTISRMAYVTCMSS
jgi:hypothetical protein